MLFRKYNIIGILLFFFHLNCLSQDTLTYMFTHRIPIDEERSLNFTHDLKQYYVNDSVFVIERLFTDPSSFKCQFKDDSSFELEKEFTGPSRFKYQFKIENNQWFMKYEADWKVFFNGQEDKFGSWKINRVDVMIQWKKTNIVDLGDTVYVLMMTCDNPFIIIAQSGVRKVVEEVDINDKPIYFTYSSGFIAIKSENGLLLIREDKEYLRDFFHLSGRN